MEIVLAGIGLTLIGVIWIEYKEYKKYQIAAKSVVAFGEGMKIVVEQMSENMGRFHKGQTDLMLDTIDIDRRLAAVESLSTTHSEILTLKLLQSMAKDTTEDGQ